MDKHFATNFALLLVILALSTAGIFFLNWKNPHVILEYNEQFKTGDRLSGTLGIVLESNDGIDSSTPLLVALFKNDVVLSAETLTIEELAFLSGKSPKIIEENNKKYYASPETYNINIEKIIDYSFVEQGEYELLLVMPKLDIVLEKKIIVE